MSGYRIEADQGDIRKVLANLDKIEKAPSKLKNAINRTATQANKMLRAGRTQGYTIKAGRFNSEIKVQRANLSHLDATIIAAGRPPLIREFKTSVPKAGAKADITKSGLKSLRKNGAGSAFLLGDGSASGLIAQRRTSERTPLKVLHGNSVPKMVEKIYEGERGGQSNMENRIKSRLHDEMQKEIAKLM